MPDTDPRDLEARIRERAHQIWLEEGQPDGRSQDHWEKARELIAMEDNAGEATEAPDKGYNNPGPWGEPVEPASILDNEGEFPTMTDQGEQQAPKKRKGGRKKRAA